MKTKKLSILLAIGLLLISGQSSTVVAIYSQSSQVKIDAAGETLDVFFDWIGTTSSINDRLSAASGTYDVVASSAGIANVQFKVNLTGTILRNDAFNVTGMNNATYTYEGVTVGELLLVVDNTFTRLDTTATGKFGATVVLNIGDHTVTLLWYTIEDDGTFMYDTESVQIRVRADKADFGEFRVAELPFTYSVTDEAVAGNNFTNPVAVYDPGWGEYIRNNTYPAAPVDISLKAASALSSGDQLNYTDAPALTMSGTTNSEGNADDVTLELTSGIGNSTVGRSFVLDAAGAHLASSVTKVSVRDGERDTGFTPYTFIGLLTIADGGMFYGYDFSYWGPTDLEDISSVNGTDVEWSAEFNAGINGTFIKGSVDALSTTITTTSTTVITEGASFSGLFALLGLFSIGTIAYLIPRKFR